ncbi:MAG: aminotransferase class I/II-fold pyridoxal phosphate-dependent enzyme, partial [Actinomycetota bacterium]|nr:aminotransferase class I/II-fold pyridoxal phosphate-dependent enzyme [Actinomycetota bacterium]
VNRFVNLAAPAPALVQLEANVVRWLCDLFELPPGSQGILTSGGSMANLSALVTARHARLGEDFADGRLYVSDQAHHSVAKAARIVGFPERAVAVVPTGADLRMDVEALAGMVRRDRDAGLRPFCVIANAGTTNTGTVDALPELADLAEREGLWLHGDAAYGGFFWLTERGRTALRGLERADSITLDPHKALFLPYGTGCLLVRDGEALRAAHMVGAEYLQDLGDQDDIPSFADYSPELSRDFRGLRVWLPLKLHGLEAFRAALDEKLDLARHVHDTMRGWDRFEVPWECDLTVVPFRYRPSAGDPEAFNRRLLERINASQRIFLSSTVVEGRFTLRVCVVSHRTHRDRIDEGLAIIRTAAEELDHPR